MKNYTLGSYLKAARIKKKLSAVEVAQRVELGSPLSVLSWERNQGHALPLKVLAKLIPLYGIDKETVFDLLLHYQMSRLEMKFKNLAGKAN